jgi:uncharacterized membrane protein YozB (DUF420 family)
MMIQALLTGVGFLGTRALLHLDISLIFIILSSVLFTIGWWLAVLRKLKNHHWIQITAVTINAIAVLIVMIPSFVIYILPGIPGKLLEGTFGITTIHAFIGALSLLMGVFVVLSTNKLLPKSLRFKNYKPFMRTSYILYMLSTLIGVIVYLAVYVIGPA